jgi:protein-L-isoaspartate(D-aspartate) O-methyltransferase
MKTGGVMSGRSGAALRVAKDQASECTFTIARSDIYNGRVVLFVPFTKLEGNVIKGTHHQSR